MSDDIETFNGDLAEITDLTDITDDLEDTEADIEAPEYDIAEQHLELLQHRDVPITERPDDADPADVAEQRRVVELDEDDYR
ncbi:hypothetical protein ACFYXS_07080 [Streptomyces sp. NPDC002574]|uniref:hypothetical protein n=1 Tax=Streptomyces sp. NPDC002574 TaxID=3364652 RepID=UPI00369AAB16